MKELINGFKNAGLMAVIEDKPLDGRNSEIFQMDIGRKLSGDTRTEFFRIYPGLPGNEATITGTDKTLCQVMLCVRERPREFDLRIPQDEIVHAQKEWGEEWEKKLAVRYQRPIFKIGEVWYIKDRTAGRKRHYLCGLDERQLFIAEVKKPCSTVREAHEDLRSTVIFAEGRAPGKTKRQGEWFFVNPSPEELAALKADIKAKKIFIEKKTAIGPGRKPHIAAELVRRAGEKLGHGWSVRGEEIFVRGAITHPDHATIKFSEWRKVIRNNEGATAQGAASGIRWID